MYKRVEKSKENKSRSVANSVTQEKNNDNSTYIPKENGVADNRAVHKFFDQRNTVSQLMTVRTVPKKAQIDPKMARKHIVPKAGQADWAKKHEKPKTTFIDNDADIKALVDTDAYDFEEEKKEKGWKRIFGTLTTTEYHKKDGKNNADEPVDQVGEEKGRVCEVGVRKEAGTHDLLIDHLQNKEST
jgi:hypothetical protein